MPASAHADGRKRCPWPGVDPFYLAWKAREFDFHMDFIELAARVNEAMPFYVVNKLMTVLHDNGHINGHERVAIPGAGLL